MENMSENTIFNTNYSVIAVFSVISTTAVWVRVGLVVCVVGLTGKLQFVICMWTTPNFVSNIS